MKKLITISAVLVLMAVTTSVAYAALKSDDFSDNSMDTSMWTLYEDNHDSVWLNETSGRLELRSTAVAEDLVAVYVANGWGLSPMEDFSFKADFHNSFTSGDPHTWATVMLGIGKGSDLVAIRGNNAIIDAAWDRSDESDPSPSNSVFGYSYTVDGNESEFSFQETRDSSDGTLYVSYDTGLDKLYLSHTGYWEINASDTISGLLKGEWGGGVVSLFLGGDVENIVAMNSGVAYLDNFAVDSGTIVLVPEPATICLLGIGALSLIRRKKH